MVQRLGSSLVSMKTGGTLNDHFKRRVTVEAFAHMVTDPDDWSPAFYAARAVAETIGAPYVYFDGHYKIKATTNKKVTLPFDDGTYDTRRAGESALPAETKNQMPVGLEWPSGLSLIGSGINHSSLDFIWDGATMDLNQTVGVCIHVRGWDGTYEARVGARNRMNGDIGNMVLDGFTTNNAALGIMADGIVGSVSWGTLQFTNCGIAMSWMGGDRCTIEKLRMTNCAAGFTVGGWWLTRNDISGSNTGLGVPPYVEGTDVYCIGWSDFVKVKSLEYSNSDDWDDNPIYEAVDTFFNTYFYKSANSRRTSDGGRCTNTGPNLTSASTLAADSPYLGISKRAWSLIGRYHRYHTLNECESLKTWGTSRAAIWASYNGESELNVPACVVGTAYIEHGGKRRRTGGYTIGGSNDFISSGADKWPGTKTYTKYWGGEGSVVFLNAWPVNTLGLMASARTVARSDVGYDNRIRRTVIDDGTGSPKIIEQLSPDFYQTPPHKYIPAATGSVDAKYYWKHFEKNVTNQMTLFAGIPTAGSQTIVATPSKRAFMERLGNRVKLKIAFDSSNFSSGGSNPIVIGFTGIYQPATGSSDYALSYYGPVKTNLISGVHFSVTDSGGVVRTFRLEPQAYELGSFTVGSTTTRYFILQREKHSDPTLRFLWSDVNGSLFNIEIEYDTAQPIDSSQVF